MSELSFNDLRNANVTRLPLFKNKKGEPAHSEPDGSDWELSAWSNAACGEGGELADAFLLLFIQKHMGFLANLIKKVERGDYTLDEARQELADEGADVIGYTDILLYRAGIDTGEAVASKFNRVSDRVGCEVKLKEKPVPYSLLSQLHEDVKRLRMTAPVDDDFPEMMHNVDSTLRAIENRNHET